MAMRADVTPSAPCDNVFVARLIVLVNTEHERVLCTKKNGSKCTSRFWALERSALPAEAISWLIHVRVALKTFVPDAGMQVRGWYREAWLDDKPCDTPTCFVFIPFWSVQSSPFSPVSFVIAVMAAK